MLNAPIKPKIIGQYEEPIRENYTDNVYLDIYSHSCTINEFRELIRKELDDNNVTLLKNIDDIKIYSGPGGRFNIRIPNDDRFQIAYAKWERIIKKESRLYAKYKDVMDKYYNELKVYNERLEKIRNWRIINTNNKPYMNRIKEWLRYYSRENRLRRRKDMLNTRINNIVDNIKYYDNLLSETDEDSIEYESVRWSVFTQFATQTVNCMQLILKLERCNLKLRKYDKNNKTVN